MSEGAITDLRPEELGGARLVAAGVEEALERFSDPELLASGRVNVISLEAVQKRFGIRWDARKDQVYDFTERVLERGVGDQGFFLRVSGPDFFIVHPELGRVAGQAACLRYLREVLQHFLGEDQMAASGVLQVTHIARGRVQAREMDERAQRAGEDGDLEISSLVEADEPGVIAVPANAEDEAPPERTLDRWTPFVANDGRKLRVSATLQPVFEAKGFARIGFRMIRRVISVLSSGEEEELTLQQVALLSTADIMRIDLATIARGIDRLRAESAGERSLSLIVPLSYASLANQKGRTEFLKQLKEAGEFVKLGVICEICDIEGVPPSALLAATSLLRPFSLLVIGRLSRVSPKVIAALEGAGLQALSFECPQCGGDAEFVGWAHTMIGAARRLAKSILVYRAGSLKRAGALASLGASHVSI